MSNTGRVNYHVHAPYRQSFVIDADGVAGNLISPELAETQITLNDLRIAGSTTYARDGVAFETYPSAITDFSDMQDWRQQYDRELAALLTDRLTAREVIVFDHTLRVDDPDANRKPARNVHSDYSPEGAEKRLVDLLGPQRAADWQGGHYAFINIWRPVENPINSAPLGFVRPVSVPHEDWIKIDLIYPDRRGNIMGLVANKHHEWIYQSCMNPNEIVYFNIYDNQGLPSVAHSAIDLVENPGITSVRKSLESRTLVRF